MVKIYGLFDPRTGELRYIGKTTQKLRSRLGTHLGKRSLGFKNYKSNWIKNLLGLGLRPEISLLDEVESSEWIFWEQWYIAYFRSIGCKLTNYSVGGDTGKPSYQENDRGEYRKNWSRNNPEKIKAYQEKHEMKPGRIAQKKVYRKSEAGKAAAKRSRQKLGRTQEQKDRHAALERERRKRDDVKEQRKEYNQRPEIKEKSRAYDKSEARAAKRRQSREKRKQEKELYLEFLDFPDYFVV